MDENNVSEVSLLECSILIELFIAARNDCPKRTIYIGSGVMKFGSQKFKCNCTMNVCVCSDIVLF